MAQAGAALEGGSGGLVVVEVAVRPGVVQMVIHIRLVAGADAEGAEGGDACYARRKLAAEKEGEEVEVRRMIADGVDAGDDKSAAVNASAVVPYVQLEHAHSE